MEKRADLTPFSDELLTQEIQFVIDKIDRMMIKFPDDFPSASSQHLVYRHKENKEWTASFFTGMIWLAYEVTGDKKYKTFAQKHTLSFKSRLEEKRSINYHDLGFLYTLSCVADYKITGNVVAREVALEAARCLAARYQKNGGFIQAWGNLDDVDEYRLIIDCFLNLPLLFWAYEETHELSFKEIAIKHYHTACQTVIREDYTTAHTYFFDRKTGLPLKEATNQGYADDSCWARGQAWAIYGIALFTKYNGLSEKENQRFEGVQTVFKERLPEDGIPAWDLIFKDPLTNKDSSAAAIAICGLQTMAQNRLDDSTESLSSQLLATLITNDTTKNIEAADGLLQHGMHHWPRQQGVDECNLWGDYFYFEALVREKYNWNSYW